MTNLDIIFYIAVGGTFFIIFTRKIFNLIEYSKINIVEINSADKNISSAKIEELIKKFMNYLKISDKELKINYEKSESYTRIFSMLNRRKKEINIPKWLLPSVGYELDYLFASIWYNVKLFRKDKGIKRMQFLAHVLPIIVMFLYYIFLMLVLSLVFLQNFPPTKVFFHTSFFSVISRIKIFEILTLFFFFVFLICELNSNKVKILLEANYERSIIKFVDEELTGYKSDITAARVYALQISKLNYDTFRIGSKTSNLKYLGPFTNL